MAPLEGSWPMLLPDSAMPIHGPCFERLPSHAFMIGLLMNVNMDLLSAMHSGLLIARRLLLLAHAEQGTTQSIQQYARTHSGQHSVHLLAGSCQLSGGTCAATFCPGGDLEAWASCFSADPTAGCPAGVCLTHHSSNATTNQNERFIVGIQ